MENHPEYRLPAKPAMLIFPQDMCYISYYFGNCMRV